MSINLSYWGCNVIRYCMWCSSSDLAELDTYVYTHTNELLASILGDDDDDWDNGCRTNDK